VTHDDLPPDLDAPVVIVRVDDAPPAYVHGAHTVRVVARAFDDAGVTPREWGFLRTQLRDELGPVMEAVCGRGLREGRAEADAPAYLELRALVLEFIRLNRPAPGTPARAAFDRRVEEFHEWCRGEREAMSTRIWTSPSRGPAAPES
jgi:hypothetical protein